MTATAEVLLAVANELAKTAKSSMPKMREGERVMREWLEDGIFYRETSLAGETFRYQYDFKQRKSRRVAVVT